MREAIADLQAQVVALRVAVEGSWLSLLSTAADPVMEARRMGAANLAAIDQMAADTPALRDARAAVKHHTEQLWNSIAWQLNGDRAD